VFVSGIRDEVREVLLTNSLDAEPEAKEEQPAPSLWPFLTAVVVSAVLIGSIFTLKAVSYGALPIAFSIIAWIWPKEHEVEERREHEKWRAA
jgi:cytochrome c oxidase subunit I+III